MNYILLNHPSLSESQYETAGVVVPRYIAPSDIQVINGFVQINDAEFLYDGRLVAIEGYAQTSGTITIGVYNYAEVSLFLI